MRSAMSRTTKLVTERSSEVYLKRTQIGQTHQWLAEGERAGIADTCGRPESRWRFVVVYPPHSRPSAARIVFMAELSASSSSSMTKFRPGVGLARGGAARWDCCFSSGSGAHLFRRPAAGREGIGCELAEMKETRSTAPFRAGTVAHFPPFHTTPQHSPAPRSPTHSTPMIVVRPHI